MSNILYISKKSKDLHEKESTPPLSDVKKSRGSRAGMSKMQYLLNRISYFEQRSRSYETLFELRKLSISLQDEIANQIKRLGNLWENEQPPLNAQQLLIDGIFHND